MKNKQREYQKSKVNPIDDHGEEENGLSQQAQEALAQLSEVDTMIVDILTSTTNGNYLESIRQRGGQ